MTTYWRYLPIPGAHMVMRLNTTAEMPSRAANLDCPSNCLFSSYISIPLSSSLKCRAGITCCGCNQMANYRCVCVCVYFFRIKGMLMQLAAATAANGTKRPATVGNL